MLAANFVLCVTVLCLVCRPLRRDAVLAFSTLWVSGVRGTGSAVCGSLRNQFVIFCDGVAVHHVDVVTVRVRARQKFFVSGSVRERVDRSGCGPSATVEVVRSPPIPYIIFL